ncbi:Rho guanine nucleotide exchange factor 6 [Hypsibius exemplaris]|uniref:Rho guanine nucleotide exchange factor 6 n=1 Tax=Hypsibius exemplaris TaxID=2072580 RepID=A0A1W0X6X0_HYPEX|nr:Rho guanine nucleotide exchange factor 6 [Hypsibius exemplaris]
MEGHSRFVKALHDYIPSNTDELAFRRGDVITVTQRADEGWWEGTLNGATGWFPVPYVAECAPNVNQGQNGHGEQDPRREHRKTVMRTLLDSERAHVDALLTFLNNVLRPIQAGNFLPEADFTTLSCNFEDICHMHSTLLERLTDITRSPSEQQAVGGVFMNMAPVVLATHQRYCSNHPRAVQVLHQYSETLLAFCETLDESSPFRRNNIIPLTVELSRPFRRLDKYPAMLQELERHLEEFNPDRGNTQRAVAVYTEIAANCAEKRRQKEIELDILKGNIKDYQGPEMNMLGEILFMSQVTVKDEATGSKQERYLVLFEDILLVLAASPRMSCFMYMSHAPLSGLKIRPVEDAETKNSFEIWAKTLERKTVQCKTKEAYQTCLDLLMAQVQKAHARTPAAVGMSNTLPKPFKVSAISASNISPPKVETVREATSTMTSPRGQRFKPPIITNPIWSGSCLRPHPPMRAEAPVKEEKPIAVTQSPKLSRKFSSSRKKDQPKLVKQEEQISQEKVQQYEDDALLLSLIDSYCISAKMRHKVTSEVLDSPHVLIAEEEKIFVEGSHGNLLEEKTLVDAVYGLKDEVKELSAEVLKLHRLLDEEKRARRRLEMSLHLQHGPGGAGRYSMNGDRIEESFSGSSSIF